MRLIALSTILLLVTASTTSADDWPMWRHNPGRTAVTPELLPDELHLQWTRTFPSLRPAWPASQTKLRFDVAYEPVVAGGRMFVGSNVNDSVTAYDIRTGEELWRFYTDGPVRFAPAVAGDRLFAVSDDGYLYCLEAATGRLRWKVNGGPSEKRILGNDRLISMWPARGGVVVADGVAYFTASIWPSMGIFIHAVDADSGKILWTNSKTGSEFVVHPHGAPSFGSIVPQGYLAVNGEYLLVPGGRSLPAVFDRHTGELVQFQFGGKSSGGYDVMTSGPIYSVRGEQFRFEDGARVAALPCELLDGDLCIQYLSNKRVLEIRRFAEKIETKLGLDRRGVPTRFHTLPSTARYELAIPESPGKLFLKASDRVYSAREGELFAYDVSRLPGNGRDERRPVWSAQVEGTVASMLAASDRLIVVTTEGRIYCYAAKPSEQVAHHTRNPQAESSDGSVSELITATGVADGYALVLGLEDGRMTEQLARDTELHIIAVDADPDRVDRIRRALDDAGLYGTRVVCHVGDPLDFAFPPYLANLIVTERPMTWSQRPAKRLAGSLFPSLRPYGGVICFSNSKQQHDEFVKTVETARLPNAEVTRSGKFTLLSRVGPLPDSAEWTAQYGDSANSVVSGDALVKAPLGVLWFGGPSNDKILPRHGHGPSPQVAGGRLFIEGPDILRAVDVYTGRLLWERELPQVGEYYNVTRHFAGAGEVGSNYVSTADTVYIVYGHSVLALDAETGRTKREFQMKGPDGQPVQWGFVTVWQDLLVVTSTPIAVGGEGETESTRKPQIPKGFQAVIPANSRWRYLAGSDPATEWASADFDDSAWTVGTAGFGYGDGDDRTTLEMREKYSRVYIRHAFDRKDLGEATSLELRINYDDAFIAYLNGMEVLRVGVGRGQGKQAKSISSHEAAGYQRFAIDGFQKLLRDENNVLAIEGHNTSLGSSDFSLDPYLIAGKESTGRQNPQSTLANAVEPVSHASASRTLVVFDRHTGERLWSRDAEFEFRHNCIAVANDKLFLIDGMSRKKLEVLRRRGVEPKGSAELLALDALSGEEIWSTTEDVFGTFLNYSEEYDVLLQAGSAYRDRAEDEVSRGMVAYRGRDGDVLWKDLEINYSGPCLLWKDKIITNGSRGFQFELLTGKQTDWTFGRMYGCNTVIGSEHLLTFRSGAAGFCDLSGDSGTGNIGGFRSSCTSNLIVADGVLSAPDYTRTCVCAYQNQTSLALVHMPEADLWTFSSAGRTVNDLPLGFNLGAPGDRRDSGGTLWWEYPTVGGPSPSLSVTVSPSDVHWFRQHPSAVESESGPVWVAASGGEGIESVTISLPESSNKSPRCTVRLHFAEPEFHEGERVFDVAVQGEPVAKEFDVAREAVGPNRAIVLEWTGEISGGNLKVELKSKRKRPILSGIEILPQSR